MDANGLRFWSLTTEGEWDVAASSTLVYDRERRTLKLKSFRTAGLAEASGTGEALVERVPQAVDSFGTYAYLQGDARHVRAAGAAPGDEELVTFTTGSVTDLALGHDGILYLARSGRLILFDPRQRWSQQELNEPSLTAFRLAALPERGMLILDRTHQQIWSCKGEPLPTLGLRSFEGDVFRPDQENPNPPRLELVATLASDEDPVAFATNSRGETLILCWLPNRVACLRRLGLDGRLGARARLLGVERPYSIGWLDLDTVATLVQAQRVDGGAPSLVSDVVPYTAPLGDEPSDAQPLGGIYPLVGHTGGPFAHGPSEPARYPSATGAAFPDPPRPLIRLAPPELARSGSSEPRVLDSGRVGTTWHRAYLEATIPTQCSVLVWLAATDRQTPPAEREFFPHAFGASDTAAGTPCAVWSPLPSELPFHRGLLPCSPEPHRAGLFSVLIQRRGRRVTSLSGRYLHVRVELAGNARATPELAALRIYGPRFSYVDQYLPRLYREVVFAPDADDETPQTTAPDFLERFLGNFEGILTPLEDRIANAHLLTDPESAPEEALDWLGQWVGFVFDAAYPAAQRRRALASTALLHRWHGTLRGLELALDILTDGALSRGEVVVIEDYRLRRTFATILGADLADEADPLTAGVADSGNSIVGDTLVLGNEYQREFLAVFRELLPEQPKGTSWEEWLSYLYQRFVDPVAVDSFFDRFAHRLTVLVQTEVSDDLVGLIRRMLELEAPAHVQTQVVRATQPFIVGLASLVGVDTFLRAPKPLPRTSVDVSRLGTTFLLRPASLDPRLEGGA